MHSCDEPVYNEILLLRATGDSSRLAFIQNASANALNKFQSLFRSDLYYLKSRDRNAVGTSFEETWDAQQWRSGLRLLRTTF